MRRACAGRTTRNSDGMEGPNDPGNDATAAQRRPGGIRATAAANVGTATIASRPDREPRSWRLRLVWVDMAKNRRRHWSISREPTLFHPEGALVRRWGRLGQYTRTGPPDPLPARQALAEARRQVESKLRKGYVVQACSRDGLLAGAPE